MLFNATDSANRDGFPGSLVGTNNGTVQFNPVTRRFHSPAHAGQEPAQDDVLVYTDDRIIRSGHACVGLICETPGQDTGIGGGSFGRAMRANICGLASSQYRPSAPRKKATTSLKFATNKRCAPLTSCGIEKD